MTMEARRRPVSTYLRFAIRNIAFLHGWLHARLAAGRAVQIEAGMNETTKRCEGGCLCGAVRYQADGDPLSAGYCYCADCRKASGSGFIPFMGFPAHAVRF